MDELRDARWRVTVRLRSDDYPRVSMTQPPRIRPEMPCVVKQLEVVPVVRNDYPSTFCCVEELVRIGRSLATFILRCNYRMTVVSKQTVKKMRNILIEIKGSHATQRSRLSRSRASMYGLYRS